MRPVPTVVLRPVLWEVADIVEQIFRIACTENLHPRPEEYDAATSDYQAGHGLSDSAMHAALRSSLTAMREVRERAQVIALMRLYRTRWRPWDPEGRRVKPSSRQGKSASETRPRKRSTTSEGKPLLESNPAPASP